MEIPDNLIKPKLNLLQVDGNAFAVMGATMDALQKAGNEQNVIDSYRQEAMNGDYDHLLQVTMAYINLSHEDDDGEEEYAVA